MKIALVTGATSGYGLATALKLQSEGISVIIASRDENKVKNAVKEHGFLDGYTIDVTNYNQWVNMYNYISEKYGAIDILVNNAGGGISIKDTTDQTAEDIDNIISLNLNSVIYGSQLFGGMMKENKKGIIVNISSVCAKHSWPGWSVYAAAKAGVLNFSKGLYVELQPYNVRVTCIIPASASTSFQKSAGLGETQDSLLPEDIANAVYFVVNQPETVVTEEMTVWGTSQVVQPL